MGVCGLRRYAGDGAAEFELGFHLCAAHWGHGLATEAGAAVLAYAFGKLGASAVFAGHNPANSASRRTLHKLGFAFTHEEYYAPTGLMHPSYLCERGARPARGPSTAAAGEPASGARPALPAGACSTIQRSMLARLRHARRQAEAAPCCSHPWTTMWSLQKCDLCKAPLGAERCRAEEATAAAARLRDAPSCSGGSGGGSGGGGGGEGHGTPAKRSASLAERAVTVQWLVDFTLAHQCWEWCVARMEQI